MIDCIPIDIFFFCAYGTQIRGNLLFLLPTSWASGNPNGLWHRIVLGGPSVCGMGFYDVHDKDFGSEVDVEGCLETLEKPHGKVLDDF